MAGAWTPSHWLHWNGPGSRTLTLAPGTFISRHIRLVRPVVDAGVQNTWVAEHLGLKLEVGVTFHVPRSGAASAATAEGVAEGIAENAAEDAELLLKQSSALSHVRSAEPHYVHVFEQGRTQAGVAFIVTELLEGKSLRNRLAHGGPLSLAELARVLEQAAGALAKAHAARLAHGNLCPDALFLTDVGGEAYVKILGFGAGFEHAAYGQGASAQAYASPEQLLQGKGPDAQSDLWALAVTLYELLTTTLPFEAPTAAGVAVAICNAQFSPPSHYRADVSPALDAWFARALAKSPADRFRSAAELWRAFAFAGSAARVAAAPDEIAGPARVAVGGELDEDEMTVRWELPTEWAGPGPTRSGLPPSLPGSGAPPPLPDRAPSSRPPPPLDSVATPGFSVSPPSPVAFPRTSYLAAVASALSVPPMPAPAAAAAAPARIPAPTDRRALDRRIIAVASLVSVLAVASAWMYSSKGPQRPLEGEPARMARTAAPELIVAQTVRAEDLPEVGSEQAEANAPDSREPPDIIHARDLAPAAEDGVVPATDLALAANLSVPPPPHAVRATAPRRATARAAGPGAASCNPPYYFDANNIRRIKLECLGGSVAGGSVAGGSVAGRSVAGRPVAGRPVAGRPVAGRPVAGRPVARGSGEAAPVQKKRALRPAPAAASPPRGKSLGSKQARAGASCTPPYFFDENNIRRLKLECL